MDDISNLLYVLFFILWFIYRVFTGSKKKKNPPTATGSDTATGQQEPHSKPAPVSFEDILRELTGAPEPTPLEPTSERELPEAFEKETYYEEEEHFEEYEPEPVPEVLTPTPTTTSSHHMIIEGGFEEYKTTNNKAPQAARDVRKLLNKSNGLKQAVILKAILDRPYS